MKPMKLGGVPRTTEDGSFNWDALTDDTGDSPEVTLADFGITSCETIPADHNFAPSNTIIVNKKANASIPILFRIYSSSLITGSYIMKTRSRRTLVRAGTPK